MPTEPPETLPLPPLSKRAYARHRLALGLPGTNESSVRRAARDGRIDPAALDAAGRIVDVELADRSWEDCTHSDRVPLSGPTSPRRAARPEEAIYCPDLLLQGLDRQGEPGAVFLGVRFALDPFLAGVADGLRAARRAPTPEAIRQALEGVPVEFWWTLVINDLNDRLDARLPAQHFRAAWVEAGRFAVAGKESSDAIDG